MHYVEVFVGGGAVLMSLLGGEPFLRWAGGKRKLRFEVLSRLMRHHGGCQLGVSYPLASCGCHHFATFLIADANPDLIAAWQAVRDDVEAVIGQFGSFERSLEGYHFVRDVYSPTARDAREAVIYRGARMIYLNTYGHAGLWRVNSTGKHNVPPQPERFKQITPDTVAANLRVVSTLLQGVDIAHADFSTTLSRCGQDDVVYCDPDYLPDNTSKFRAYTTSTETPITKHRRLAIDVAQAVQRGARAVISNSPAAQGIYDEVFPAASVKHCVDMVSTQRSIGVGKGAAVKRRQDEILVTVSRQ